MEPDAHDEEDHSDPMEQSDGHPDDPTPSTEANLDVNSDSEDNHILDTTMDVISNVFTDGDNISESIPQESLSENGQACPGKECEAPILETACAALKDLKVLLHPCQKTGAGYINPKINPFICIWMEAMQMMLNFYVN